jgi:hypothetical protein
MVPKTQHPITPFFQEPTPFLIRRNILRVLTAVQFHYQLSLRTTKISNERTYGMLPAKLGSDELSISKLRPESLLGVGLIATQLARFDPNAFHASGLAQELPHPCPLPLRGRGN